jgi:hypothetical protein
MPPFLDELRTWFEGYSDAGGRGIRVQFSEGPPEIPKRSAWITAQGAAAIGELMLWESGECETEAHTTTGDRTPILLRSRVLDEPTRVPAIADDLVDHVADYSNS